jgi:nitroimidazol reductase NimA-like FMN-containing flavoprotein (pyridoxamine 5'-phosphate oxidase superfamily)
MIGKLNDEQIEEVLRNGLTGNLACHADGRTYIVPVSFAYDNNAIYVHTQKGMKIEMMRKNPSVCFQTDDRKDMANWRSVIAWGDFEELTNEEERNNALRLLLNRPLPIISSTTTHLGSQWPFASKDLSAIKGILFRVRLHEKTGRYEHTTYTPGNAG